MSWPSFTRVTPTFKCGCCHYPAVTEGRQLRLVMGLKTWVGACCLPPTPKKEKQ